MKKILILSGDGIGPEVCAEAEKFLNHMNSQKKQFEISKADIGGIAIDNHGEPFPESTENAAKAADAVLLGAVGGHKWDGLHSSKKPEKGLLAIRKSLELFANLRPAIVFPELADASTLKKEFVSGLDIMIVRELTGGIYFGYPRGTKKLWNGGRKAWNTEVYKAHEITRISKVAFDLAKKRKNKVCSVDKANVLEVSELWRQEVIREHHHHHNMGVELSHMYVDNAAMQLVRNPKQFDVVVTNNIFGDILSDIAAQLTGSLGMLPSASLGEQVPHKPKKCHALYEPIHGSAPDIAGKNIANPIATILSIAMMFKYSFDMQKESDNLEQAVRAVLAQGKRTADIMQEGCTKLGTKEMGDAILQEYKKVS
jgi:3-isopropylmalate dehydrogenase